MSEKAYCMLTGALFSIGVLVHLARLITGWPIVIAGWSAPLWVSWIGILVGGVLAFYGFRFGLSASRPA
ncbi:MAG: hypothetical protein QOG83_2209 [Alphaproteobacteria bacterium]|jgi:ABC-type microcin C transport system permease subunit YejE|nr:hypothetical protein [Alphaproteobacteria bacterium]MEA2989498.1 hypothetical protein [Alphaproteobacteria bacterium]